MKTFISTDSLEISNEDSIYRANFRPYTKQNEQLKLNKGIYPRKDLVPQFRLTRKSVNPSRQINVPISRQDSMQSQKTWSWPIIKPKQHFSVSGKALSVSDSYQLSTIYDQCRPEPRRVQKSYNPKENSKKEPLLSVFARYCNKDFNNYLSSVLNYTRSLNGGKTYKNLYSNEKMKEILSKYPNLPKKYFETKVPNYNCYHNLNNKGDKEKSSNQYDVIRKELDNKLEDKIVKCNAKTVEDTHAIQNGVQTNSFSTNSSKDKANSMLTSTIDQENVDSNLSSSSTDSITFIFLGSPEANNRNAIKRNIDQEIKTDNSLVNSSRTNDSVCHSRNSLSVDSLENQPVKRTTTPRTLSLDSLATENILMHLQSNMHPNLRLLNKRNRNLTSFRTLQNKQDMLRKVSTNKSPPESPIYSQSSSEPKTKTDFKKSPPSSPQIQLKLENPEIENNKDTLYVQPQIISQELPNTRQSSSSSQETQTFEEFQIKNPSKRQGEMVADVALVDFVCSVTDLMKEGVKLLRDIRLGHHYKRHHKNSHGSSTSPRESEGYSVFSENTNSSGSDIYNEFHHECPKHTFSQNQKNGASAKQHTSFCKNCSEFPNRCAKKKLFFETIKSPSEYEKCVKRQNSGTESTKSTTSTESAISLKVQSNTTSEKSTKVKHGSFEMNGSLKHKENLINNIGKPLIISSNDHKITNDEDNSHSQLETIQEISRKYTKLIEEMELLDEELSSRSTLEYNRRIGKRFSKPSERTLCEEETRNKQKGNGASTPRSHSKKQDGRTPSTIKSRLRCSGVNNCVEPNEYTPSVSSYEDGFMEDRKEEKSSRFMKSSSTENSPEIKINKAVKFTGKHIKNTPSKMEEPQLITNAKKPEKLHSLKERNCKLKRQSSTISKRGSDDSTLEFPTTSSVHPLFRDLDNHENSYSLESNISDWFLPDNYKTLPRFYHN